MFAIARSLPVALLIGIALGIAIGAGGLAIVAAQAPSASPPTAAAEAEVRITGRLLENGKVEFGLQQREDDGWGEIILPRVNKFPYATATVDRWLYSSPVTVTVASGLAAGWQRSAWAVGTNEGVEWHLDGTGVYGADGPAGADNRNIDARPQLRLSCSWAGDEYGWGHGMTFSAQAGYFDFDRSPSGRARVRYRVEGGAVNWQDGVMIEYITPEVLGSGSAAFMDWLAVNYKRNPVLTLDAYTDGALHFTGTFDLTGLPAVLADLPCFEPFE